MICFKYLFIFLVFSIIGWIMELIYRSIVTKKIVNPGFMSGCVVPLYGFGAIIMNIICGLFDKIDFSYKIVLIFITSIILLSLLEFISGLILLKIFHLKLWDYSCYKFNYKGFICLEFSMLWGFLSLVFYLGIYPWLGNFATIFVENTIFLFILGIVFGVFIVDLCVSIQLLSRLTKYANSIKQIIDLEKLKIDVRRKATKKKIIDSLYPYISTNRFLKDKINKK